LGIEKTVEEMLPQRQYENMIMSYILLKVMIDRDYDFMVNQTLWMKFIKPILHGIFNQFVIILLFRALANAINKEIWRAFLDSKIDYELSLKKTKGKKQNKIVAALDQAGKSASTQIAEQVDAHLKGARKEVRKN